MSPEKLIDALETYSNAILGFIVLQSAAFSFTYGSNAHFSCLVDTDRLLAYGLISHFVVSTALACGAIAAMSKTMQQISTQYLEILKKLYWGKIVVVLLFAALPVVLLSLYGFNKPADYAKCIAASMSS